MENLRAALTLYVCTFWMMGLAAAQNSEPAGVNLPAQKIGANDLVALSVYGSPELTGTLRVSAEGQIRLPMLKRTLKAAGLVPRELETAVAEALKAEQILVDPVVTVTVAEYRSRPISVAGAVKRPLTFQAFGIVTLLDAIIAAPQLYHADGTVDPNCRRFPTPGTLALRALRVDEIWKSPRVRRYLMDRERSAASQVDWVTGAVLMARRSAVEAVGLLDERYFLYWEDLDWCYRMRQAGWGVYRVPEARAIHAPRREGVRRPFSRAGRAQLRGAFRFFRKFGWNPGKVA